MSIEWNVKEVLSLPAGQRPEPLRNPMSSTTQAYLRMASRSARNSSMDNLAEAGEPMLLPWILK